MQKIFLLLVVFGVSLGFGKPVLTITSKVEKNAPVDNLTEISFDKGHEYLMYIVDDAAFGAEKVFFEIKTYDEDMDKYVYAALYTVDSKTDWGYCYKGIIFNTTGKFRIHVFTDVGDLATKDVEVVSQ